MLLPLVAPHKQTHVIESGISLVIPASWADIFQISLLLRVIYITPSQTIKKSNISCVISFQPFKIRLCKGIFNNSSKKSKQGKGKQQTTKSKSPRCFLTVVRRKHVYSVVDSSSDCIKILILHRFSFNKTLKIIQCNLKSADVIFYLFFNYILV